MEGIDKNTFKRIFYDHWDAFKPSRPRFDNPDYNETVNKMLGCGDPDKMGFVQYRCPWTGPSDWFKYRCRSCDHTDWVEDIVVDSFPPAEPGGLAAIVRPKCGGHFRYDPSEPVKRSLQHPDHSF